MLEPKQWRELLASVAEWNLMSWKIWGAIHDLIQLYRENKKGLEEAEENE